MSRPPAPPVAEARARVAGLRRHYAPDDPRVAQAEQRLILAKARDRFDRAEKHLKSVVATSEEYT
jgi:hypothetical protein